MASLASITQRLGSRASNVLLTQVIVFLQATTRLRNHILAVCESKHLPDVTPEFLPDAPCKLLARMCDMSEEDVERLWDVLGDLAWRPDKYLAKIANDEAKDRAFADAKHPAFRVFFFSRRDSCINSDWITASSISLWPPVDTCFNELCPYVFAHKPLKLQGIQERKDVVYTLGRGAIATKYFHLTCDGTSLTIFSWSTKLTA